VSISNAPGVVSASAQGSQRTVTSRCMAARALLALTSCGRYGAISWPILAALICVMRLLCSPEIAPLMLLPGSQPELEHFPRKTFAAGLPCAEPYTLEHAYVVGLIEPLAPLATPLGPRRRCPSFTRV
jgi:hypothetical protein